MKQHKNITLLLISILLIPFACTKEVYVEVDNNLCNESYTSHPNNQLYQDVLDAYALKGVTGISVVIAKPNEELWVGTSGYASIEDDIKMNNCHLHHTASLAKSFIGIITLQLIEEGKLDFDSKITEFLSAEVQSYTPNVEDVEIKHLLQHTSGIPDVFEVPFFTELMNDPSRIYSTEELLQFNESVEALNAVGEKHNYSDHNYLLLALIIDQIEGDHINSMRERIFKPLGLSGLHYHDSNYPNVAGLVASYWDQHDNGNVENISDIQTSLTNYILGSDGIIASPLDMTLFYQSVFSGELVSNEMLDLIKSDWVKELTQARMNTSYSHGFMVLEAEGENWMGHVGLHIGASCYVYHSLDSETTIGVFTNTGTFFSNEKKGLIYFDLWDDLQAVLN